MEELYLGLDTSAYTTSIGVVNQHGQVVLNLRKPLAVKKGSRGLRQQEAVFQHVNNIPEMIEILTNNININNIKSVSVSAKPRNVEGSYMPVFKVGKGQAFTLSKVLDVKYSEFSHQDGHIASAFIGSDSIANENFLALHISGGTTELLMVRNINNQFDIEIIGGTKDISAGQLIDRIGVKLGLDFPSGKVIDDLSLTGEILPEKLPISTKGTWVNYSGSETFFLRLIDKNDHNINDISKSLLFTVASSLKKIILKSLFIYNLNNIVITGGVAANSFIREYLLKTLSEENDVNVFYPNKEYCTDNAVGIAYLGSR